MHATPANAKALRLVREPPIRDGRLPKGSGDDAPRVPGPGSKRGFYPEDHLGFRGPLATRADVPGILGTCRCVLRRTAAPARAGANDPGFNRPSVGGRTREPEMRKTALEGRSFR